MPTKEKKEDTMFHGITNSGQGWTRVLTAKELNEGEKVLEQFDGGPYWPAFLETFFPGKYRIEVRKLSNKNIGRNTSGKPKADPNLSPNEVIRWSNSTDQYSVLIDDAPLNDGGNTWLEAFDQIGLIVGNSKKMSKRLTEIVRLASAWHYSPNGTIKIETIDHLDQGYLDEHVDGISAISQSFAIRCIAGNHLASGEWTNNQISKILYGITTVVQIRVFTADGLIKGNGLILPDKMMKGYDIRTFKPNIKSEIRTLGWQFATIEPSYSTIPVKSDDLTHAIYQSVNGMYTHLDLLETLDASLSDEYAKLIAGQRTTAMTALVDNADRITRSDSEDEDRFRNRRSTLQIVQQTIQDLTKLGVPFESTQNLRFLTVNGIATQYLGVGNGNKVGQIWRDKGKHWMPVQWAYTAHIMTQEVLEIFGFKNVYSDNGYYHAKTHCFVVPGKFFVENIPNHGGPDLDDSVKVHVRLVRMPDGKIKLMAILLRNPNDFGEWSMIPIKGYGPIFHRYSALPPVVDYKELITRVPQSSTLTESGLTKAGVLPGMSTLSIGNRFSIADESRTRLAAMAFPGGVGSSVLPKMVHYALNKTYLADQVATNEDIIDALQQGLATQSDVKLIRNWTENTFLQIIEKHGNNGTAMDLFWMATRLPKQYAEGNMEEVVQSTTVEESPWCQTHISREMSVRTTFAQMCDYLNSTMIEPEVIMNVNFTDEERQRAYNLHLDISTRQRSMTAHAWVQYMVDLLGRTDNDEEKGIEYTNRIMLMLAYQSYIAKRQYPRQSHDQWLYTFSINSNKQIVDWYIRALESIQPQISEE
jgi:hypothetical protein